MRSSLTRELASLIEMPLTGRQDVRPALRALSESLPDFRRMAQRNRRLSRLERDMRGAATYADYRAAAIDYDTESGLEEWKLADPSPLYDYKLIQRRLAQVLAAREGGYVRRLMFILQEGLHGNLGNISNPMLYRHTRFGTKRLIERYLDEVCESLEFLCDDESADVSLAEKIQFFESTSHTFGQSSLMLSGGATLGVYHLGVVRSLWENGLLPHVISGSSAGSIVAALLGTRSDEQLREVLIERGAMEDLIKWNRPLGPYLFDAAHFSVALRGLIGEMSFQEAMRLSGRSINIPVSPYDALEDARLLNSHTTPNVLINSAVRASCAAPFLMPPSELLAKTINGEIIPYLKKRKFLDGSISDDLPIRRLTRLYGVNHSIVSLVNPLVLPFVSRRVHHGKDIASITRRFTTRMFKETLNYSLELLQKGVPSDNVNFTIDKLQSVLMQEYRGDITLIPPRRLMHLFKVVRKLDASEEIEMVKIGERMTWPHLEVIKNTTVISRTFRHCLNRLYERASTQDRGRAGRARRARAG